MSILYRLMQDKPETGIWGALAEGVGSAALVSGVPDSSLEELDPGPSVEQPLTLGGASSRRTGPSGPGRPCLAPAPV